MATSTKLWMILALLAAAAACSTARDPAKGFRLAGDGDPHRGKEAFLEFRCHTCHAVQGSTLPQATTHTVTLGGSVAHQPSDGYLVTAIINPAYHAAHDPIMAPAKDGQPHMPQYASRMTVQQLTDVVAYLQTRYALSPLPVQNEYP